MHGPHADAVGGKRDNLNAREKLKKQNLRDIVAGAQAWDKPSPGLRDAAAKTRTRAELAASNLAAAKRIAKVSTREIAKSGNHAVLILPDAHFPFNDEEATDLVIKIAEVVRPARIVSLGDTLEAAAWTMHAPRSIPEEATHAYSLEVEKAGAWIDRVREAAGTSPSWAYLEGNHEAHVERECLRLGSIGRAIMDLVSPKTLLMRGRDWMTWTPYVEAYSQDRRSPGQRGGGMSHHLITTDLWAVHGWTIAKNAAQKHLDMMRGGTSLVHGHTHRIQSVTERVHESGKHVRAWSPGCLSNTQPTWHHLQPTLWTTGVSIAFCEDACLIKRDPKWTAYTVEICRGEAVLPGGTSIRV